MNDTFLLGAKLVVSVVCLVLCIVQLQNNFQQYIQRLTTTTINILYESPMQLPTLSVCPKAPYKTSYVPNNEADYLSSSYGLNETFDAATVARILAPNSSWQVSETRSPYLGRCFSLRYLGDVEAVDLSRPELYLYLLPNVSPIAYVHNDGDQFWLSAMAAPVPMDHNSVKIDNTTAAALVAVTKSISISMQNCLDYSTSKQYSSFTACAAQKISARITAAINCSSPLSKQFFSPPSSIAMTSFTTTMTSSTASKPLTTSPTISSTSSTSISTSSTSTSATSSTTTIKIPTVTSTDTTASTTFTITTTTTTSSSTTTTLLTTTTSTMFTTFRTSTTTFSTTRTTTTTTSSSTSTPFTTKTFFTSPASTTSSAATPTSTSTSKPSSGCTPSSLNDLEVISDAFNWALTNPDELGCPLDCTSIDYASSRVNYITKSSITFAPNAPDPGTYLSVYFDSNEVEHSQVVLMMDLPGLLSAIGGSLGLFLGFSCLTIIHYAIEWTATKAKNKKTKVANCKIRK